MNANKLKDEAWDYISENKLMKKEEALKFLDEVFGKKIGDKNTRQKIEKAIEKQQRNQRRQQIGFSIFYGILFLLFGIFFKRKEPDFFVQYVLIALVLYLIIVFGIRYDE